MKRYSKELIKSLESLGFDYIWTNSAGYLCYAHPNDPDQQELSVSPSITNEQTLKVALRRARKIAGADTVVEKRKASQVKDRAEADRARARQRLQWIQAKRQQLIDADADATTIAKAQELIALRERELADIERLMKQPAHGGNAHRGGRQARHWSGQT